MCEALGSIPALKLKKDKKKKNQKTLKQKIKLDAGGSHL
jgi:hypothetical protein